MEEMNITEMVAENNMPMEAPVIEAGVTENKGSVAGAVVTIGGIILVYEGVKRVSKKAFRGIKNFVAKKKAAKTGVIEGETIEVECVEQD